MIPADFNPQQFVPVAALHAIGDQLFRALSSSAQLHFLRARQIIHFRVVIPLSLQSLANISFALFQQVRIHRTFLVYRDQLFQIALRKFRSRHRNLHARPLGHLQLQRHRIRLRVVFPKVRHRSRVQVPLLHQKLPDPRRSPLHSCRRHLSPRLHLHPRNYFLIHVFRAVLQLNFPDARSWARLHFHNHVHLMFLRMRRRIRGNLRGKKSFLPQHFPQSFQSFVHQAALVRFPQRKLHRRNRRCLARW